MPHPQRSSLQVPVMPDRSLKSLFLVTNLIEGDFVAER